MSAEIRFWQWFTEHEEQLAAAADGVLLTRVNTRLAITHPGIGCLLEPPAEQGPRGLIITAHGDIENFPAVDELIAAAPQLKLFRPVAFVPPNPASAQTESDVRFRCVMEDDRANLTLFVENYDPNQLDTRFSNQMQTLLSALLGEYACETKIAAVDFAPLEGASRKLPPVQNLASALR